MALWVTKDGISTASVQPGSSGGPLFNKSGDLVGINNAGINNALVRKQYKSEAKNVNYAIKSKYLYELIEDLNISIFINDGIDRMSLSEQYNTIKDFVYIVFCSKTTKKDIIKTDDIVEIDDIDISENIDIFDDIDISDYTSGDYSIYNDPTFQEIYEFWKSQIDKNELNKEYHNQLSKYNKYKSALNDDQMKVQTVELKSLENRIKSFKNKC